MLTVFSGVASAHHTKATKINVPKKTTNLRNAYLNLYEQAEKRGVAGRNVVRFGRPKDGKADHSLVVKEFIRLWYVFNPKVKVEHERVLSGYYQSDRYLYDVWRTKGVKTMVSVALEQQGVPEWARSRFHTIIRCESGYNPNADNPTSTALGISQFLNTWGPDYQRRDPVWSIKTMIRSAKADGYSFNPWALTRNGC